MARHQNIINQDDVKPRGFSFEEKFDHSVKSLSTGAGSKQLGCSLFEVAPGKTAIPTHFHYANEEAIYILAGNGTIRLGDKEYPVSKGDYVAFLPKKELAHSLKNSGSSTLQYLCMSTMQMPEVVGYPDSNKIGVFAGTAWDDMLVDLYAGKEMDYLVQFHKNDSGVNFFEGE